LMSEISDGDTDLIWNTAGNKHERMKFSNFTISQTSRPQ
jgi:hypothetical protein